MKDISKSVVRKDHEEKITGSCKYVADYDSKGVLIGKLVRSKKAHGKLIGINFPKMPNGYMSVTYEDVPGINEVHIVKDDTPVFAKDSVEYIGEPVAMIIGPDEKIVNELVKETELIIDELEPVLDILKSDTVFFDYEYTKGDHVKAFKEADKVYEETFSTGYQEQAYLETQGMMAEPEEDGKILVHGSMQCVYYVHNAVKKVLGSDDFHIRQDPTGGGFGGKEAWPSIVASEVAVAAYKAKKPVRLVFDRREDLEFTSKRHPSITHYRVAVKDGRVTAMDIDVKFNAGAYTTLSAVVLQRGLICADGVYNIPNLIVKGKALKTNTVPNGAYRGFGAPQTFFPVETIMSHIAQDMGKEPLEFKREHLVKQGDMTSTSGMYHFPVPLEDMIEEVAKASGFYEKRKKYSEKQSGRYRRGIGISMHFHGAGFTGAGERDLIKAVAKLKKHKDGTVEVLAANGEIGQGLRTTFPKIVAHELGIPLDRVYYNWPDTGKVPDSGPTVASRSLMVVGELMRRLAIKLKEIWKDGEEQIVEERFREPSFVIPFNLDIFQGDAYPTYAWGVQAVEIELDTLTGLMKNLGTWASFDVGTPADYNIVMGQMEGGLLQGLGYSSMEKMDYDKNGRIRNNNFSDYLIPTSMDVPNMNVQLHVEEYPDGPYGAKGAGELPLVGVPAAYVEAVSQALGGVRINHIPFTQEDAMKEIAKKDE